jgi:DNA repair exonuclease SbcCD ATPase subunit
MGMFTEWRDDEIAKLRQQLQEARAENAALVAEFQRLADEPPTLEEIAADLDKIEMLEKELTEARAETERLEKTAEIETILAVTDMYYAAKCNHCGWIGSSKFCVEARAGCADDCEVFCPLCFRHISDDEPSLKDLAEFLSRDVIKIVERKDRLIERMREALASADDLIDEYAADYEHRDNVDEIREEIKAALSAAERGE